MMMWWPGFWVLVNYVFNCLFEEEWDIVGAWIGGLYGGFWEKFSVEFMIVSFRS